MRTHDHDELKATTDAHLAARSPTLMPTTWRFDPRIYVDPDHARIEQATVFDALPLLAAHSSEIAEPHAYVSRSLAGTPVLVVRQPDGSVRAFLNSCRHRGTEVVWGEGAGCTRRFTCPYHGWTYGTDGRLVGLTTTVGFPDLDRASHGLAELPCAERHGLVWVVRQPGGTLDYDASFGALDEELTAMELGRFVAGPAVELTVDANWKLIMDGFLETYHLRFLHAKTLTRILHGDQAPFQPFGDHSRHVVPRLSYDGVVHQHPEDFLTNVLVEYTLFPNTNLMWAIDHFEVYQVEPVGGRPDRCRVRLTLLVDPATAGCAERWEKNLEIAQRVIVSEDFAAATSIQRALVGGAAPAQFVLGRNEAPLQHYHQRLDALWSRTRST